MGYDSIRKDFGFDDSMSDDAVLDSAYARVKKLDASITPERFLEMAQSAPKKAAPAAPAPPARRMQALTTGDPRIDASVRGAQSLIEGGGYTPGGVAKYVAGTPGRALKEIGAVVTGIGPAMTGAAHFATLPPRMMIPGKWGLDAREEFQRALRAGGQAIPTVGKEVLRGMLESYTNPVGSFVERPVSTALDFGVAAEAPSIAAGVVARAAARAGQKEVARGAAQFASRTNNAAQREALLRYAEEQSPVFKAWREERKVVDEARTAFANRVKEQAEKNTVASKGLEEAAAGVRGSGALDALLRRFPGLQKVTGRAPGFPEREAVQAAAMGTASILPGPETEAMRSALDYLKRTMGEEQAKAIAEGLVKERTAEVRKYQPLRMVTGGEEQLAYEAAPRREMSVKGIKRQIKATEKLIKNKSTQADKLPELETQLAELKDLRAAAIKNQSKYQAALRREARASAREAEAGKYATPLEPIDAELASPAFGRRKGRWSALGERRRISVKAGESIARSGIAKDIARMERLTAQEAPRGVSGLSSMMGSTRARRAAAASAKRSVESGVGRLARMETKQAETAGRVPALERLERQNEQVKWMMPGVDPSYVPMIPGRGEKFRRAFSTILPKMPLKTTQPGYLKRSKGSMFLEGKQEKDFASTTAQHLSAVHLYERNRGFLDDLAAKVGRPVSRPQDVDYSTEVLMAPDTYRRALVGDTMDAADELATGAVGTMAKKEPGVAPEGRLFAIPKAAAREAEGQMAPMWGGMLARAFFEAPNDYLRWTALTLRPGFYVNNLAGNFALATTAGVGPSGYRKAADPEIAKIIPSSVRGLGMGAVEAPAAGVGASRLQSAKAFLDNLNTGVDEFMRRATFISEIEKRAAKKALMQSGERFDKAMSFAEKMDTLGPDEVAAAARHVNDFLNDYAKQAPWQRRVLRRFLPFQSFLVHMAKLTARMPVNYPGRAKMIQSIAEMGNEYQNEQWRESGVDPENVPAWRMGQLPIRGSTKTGTITTLGTQGFNPTSGLGFNQTEMRDDPTAGGLASALADQLGPGPSWLRQIIEARTGIGQPFSKPGVKTAFGTNQATDAETGEPVAPPRPTLIDLIRQSSPQIGLVESLAQPKETYDLVGSPFPWSDNYLPTRVDRPRRYGFGERLGAHFGVPYRTFEPSEVTKKPKSRKARKEKSR